MNCAKFKSLIMRQYVLVIFRFELFPGSYVGLDKSKESGNLKIMLWMNSIMFRACKRFVGSLSQFNF